MSLEQVKESIRNQLVKKLSSDTETDKLPDPDDVKLLIANFFAGQQTPLSFEEKKQLSKEIVDDVLGFGPMQKYIDDPTVSEIMVNGLKNIYIERNGQISETKDRFINDQQLRRIIDKIVSTTSRRVDESTPMVDARLPDGSRVNVIIPPLSVDGMNITVRKFSHVPLTVVDLIQNGTFTKKVADFIHACVQGRMNIIITGGTGTGKTTTLNVLSSFIPESERIVTIEDAAELQLSQKHVVRLESRPPNIEGKGQVTVRDLVRNSLRMRPDRIVVGEARGGEALDMLQAMNTGHDGSMSTIHCNSPRDALSRLETMVLMSGMELPIRAIRDYVSSAINLIIHQARLSDGTRRVTNITEITGMENEFITIQDIFAFDFAAGVDGNGKFKGNLKATGIRPRFADRLIRRNIPLPVEIFEFDPMVKIG